VGEEDKWKELASKYERAAEESPKRRRSIQMPTSVDPTRLFALIVLVVLVLLTIAQTYTCVRISNLQDASAQIKEQTAKKQEEMNAELKKEIEETLDSLKSSYQRETRGMRQDVMAAAGSVDATRQEIQRTRAMTESLRKEQERRAAELAQQVATKADREQLAPITQNLTATRQDLNSTKEDVQKVVDQLGMTRSEMGTLIARNQNEITALRRLGERDYFEFVLDRGNLSPLLGGIRLELTKTNVRRLRYNMAVLADDLRVEKKDLTINEAVFFYVRSHKTPLELVVNKIQKNRVTGYVSAPKEVAAR
jgi:hypothetical protein